jgi:hypothetical protein
MRNSFFSGTTKPFSGDAIPVTYFRRWGFSINEGGGPANIHMQWNRGAFRFFFYVYVLGLRWSFCIKRRGK